MWVLQCLAADLSWSNAALVTAVVAVEVSSCRVLSCDLRLSSQVPIKPQEHVGPLQRCLTHSAHTNRLYISRLSAIGLHRLVLQLLCLEVGTGGITAISGPRPAHQQQQQHMKA